MASTFSAVAAVVWVVGAALSVLVGAALSVLLVHPDNARAPLAANTAAMRQIFPRRS
jgi:hypothetical protein